MFVTIQKQKTNRYDRTHACDDKTTNNTHLYRKHMFVTTQQQTNEHLYGTHTCL